eukprot:145812-Chlamydomonas_euryale.AAC.7
MAHSSLVAALAPVMGQAAAGAMASAAMNKDSGGGGSAANGAGPRGGDEGGGGDDDDAADDARRMGPPASVAPGGKPTMRGKSQFRGVSWCEKVRAACSAEQGARGESGQGRVLSGRWVDTCRGGVVGAGTATGPPPRRGG